jgi:hypothetical protein
MALIAALLCTMMLLALGGALAMTAGTETQSASSQDLGREALHAAEATAERAIDDLALMTDWSGSLDGSVRSAFTDGPPAGTRTISGTTLDLDVLTTDLNGWSGSDGVWRLFAYAPLSTLLPDAAVASRMYGVAWISADAAQPDAVVVMAHAFGPLGVRRMVAVTIARTAEQNVRVVAWQEYRQ